MEIKKVVVTGEEMFINRYQYLFKAMSSYFDELEILTSGSLYNSEVLNFSQKLFDKLNSVISPSKVEKFWKSEQTFISRSQNTERKIRQLKYTPDLVFHIFCMFSPFWNKFDIPYVMYLDYTMALAKKNWLPWAPFNNQEEFAAWVKCERLAYEQAKYLFTMSNLVKSSLIKNYNIKPEKIKVLGSSANFQELYEGEKIFQTKQILLNGSDFERKGGDLVVAAFKQVKKIIPDAKLVIIGKKLDTLEDGIINPGNVSSREEMQSLFLATDLVVAPSRCDPFPTFVMEAMNYGVPCIVSANDGMPEIVDDRVNGIVVERLNPESLAFEIVSLLNDTSTLTAMSQQARHKIKTKLNWNNIAKNISQTLVNKT